MANLTTAQVAAIETTDVAVMTTNQVANLTTAGVAALTTAQIQALTTSTIGALTTSGVANLTTAQVAAIETSDVAALKTSQVANLTTAGVAALTTAQTQALTTAGVAALTTTQIQAVTTTDVAALTTTQVYTLTTTQVASLTTTQIAAMETTDISTLKTTQIQSLTTSQIQSLTTSQISALSTRQVESLTTTQMAALTTTQVQGHLAMGTPVILDLNGDGVKTLSVSDGVNFDLFATGKKVSTGWVSGNDGLLVMDRNHDGVINDGSELFGSSTNLANGQKASDGYAALRELDTNHDGVLNSKDAAFADLQVWVDSNSDGITETGELKSLASLGISSISTQATADLSKDNGNLVGLVSSYQTTDGATHQAADVWFVADRQASVVAATDTPPLATLDFGATPLATAVPAPVPDPTNLRTQVTGLAQAISSFGDTAGATPFSALPSLNGDAAQTKQATQTLVSMVDVMKQFDANGNMLSKQVPLAASLTSPSGAGVMDPTQSALLASPGSKLLG